MVRSLLIPFALGLLSASTSVFSQNPPICEHPVCDSQEYSIIKSSRCKSCTSNYEPPGVDEIDCQFDGNGYSCEIWPHGDGLSYSYWGSPMLQVSEEGPTESSFVYVGCAMPGRSGTLTVTVTSPYGLSSSDSIGLPCRWLQGN